MITGGSSGIGAALARELRGERLDLRARRPRRGAAARARRGDRRRGGGLRRRRPGGGRRARGARDRAPPADQPARQQRRASRRGRTSSGEAERIEAVMRVNYLGSVWCLRAFLPALEAAAPSDVVNVVSVAGTVAVPQSGPYAASKHAQLAFSRATGGAAPPARHPRAHDPPRLRRDARLPAVQRDPEGVPLDDHRPRADRPVDHGGDPPRPAGELRAVVLPAGRVAAGAHAGD